MAISGRATCFADPSDVARFHACKAKGHSDKYCFGAGGNYGDNAIGVFGDSTAEGSGPSCALHPEDMRAKWGSIAGAKHKPVRVTAAGKDIICFCKDELGHLHKEVVIDLNPDSIRALGMEPGPNFSVHCSWEWA